MVHAHTINVHACAEDEDIRDACAFPSDLFVRVSVEGFLLGNYLGESQFLRHFSF